MRLLGASLLLAGANFFAHFAHAVDMEQKKPIPISLAELYQDQFDIGAAIKSEHLDETFRRQIFLGSFGRLTAEYEMKWGQIFKENRYDFSAADKLMDFARDYGIKVTGHTLVWHIDHPVRLFENAKGGKIGKAELRQRMRQHIFTTMNHFQGVVDNWDVVNEAISDKEGEVYRRSEFYQIYGDQSYIVDAFRFARQADPNMELWYNDYMLEHSDKLEKLQEFIRYMKQQRVDLAGIGFQGHYSLEWPTIDMIEKAFQLVIKEGLKIKVSELDVTVYNDYLDGVFQPEPEKACDAPLLAKQAQRYRELFELFRKYKDHIAHVTFWGLTDETSWLNGVVKGREDCPLLFDKSGRAKPAYHAISQFK
ncbi:MAG: endo-1,4-beta-xylanase [Oligoflexus sp.]